MKDEIYQLAIAGFLHDIGKIGQRGDIDLTEQSKRMEQHLCPLSPNKQHYTRKHVLWTSQFIDEHQAIFLNLVPEDKQDNWVKIHNLASYHHQTTSDTIYNDIIKEADSLASGHDRSGEKAEEEARKFKTTALASIFSEINIGKDWEQTYYLFPLPNYPSIETPQNNINEILNTFPTKIQNIDELRNNQEYPQKYSLLWNYITQTLQLWNAKGHKVSRDQFLLALDTLGALALSFVPAGTQEAIPLVSLYDHSKLVAAFSATLGKYHILTNTLNPKDLKNRNTVKFRFVIGSISGIQDFIFRPLTGEQQRGAAKRYRSRSFELSMITNKVAMSILHTLRLPVFNKIIDAGGRFILLVDNTQETFDSLNRIIEKIQYNLNKQYFGMITLNLDYSLTATCNEFLEDNFRKLYTKIGTYAEKSKYQPKKFYLQKDGKWLSKHFLLEPGPGNSIINWREEEKTRSQKIGSQILKNRYVRITTSEDFNLDVTDDLDFKQQNSLYWQLTIDNQNFLSAPVGLFYTLTRVPVWEQKQQIKSTLKYLSLLSSEDDKDNPAQILTFHSLAYLSCNFKSDKDSYIKIIGTPMLGCLKADVDNLGKIFKSGITKNVSIGKIVTLSRLFDHFFKVIIQKDMATQDIYPVFSGGDDLFLVGPWNKILEFTDLMQNKFANYCCYNPNITLSAGLSFAKPAIAIHRLAELAEDALHNSKTTGKNKITLFGRELSWNNFALALKQAKEFLNKHNNYPDVLSHSFIYRLLNYEKCSHNIELAIKQKQKIDNRQLLWKSHLVYDVSRNITLNDQNRKTEEQELKQWLLHLIFSTDSTFKISPSLKLICLYVLYNTREVKNEKQTS